MIIRMIAGKLFYKSTAGQSQEFSPADGAFFVDDETALRLIEQGVALSAEADSPPEGAPVDEPDEPNEQQTEFESLTRAQLLEYAEMLGIPDADKIRSKSKLIEAINAAADDDSAIDATGAID